MIFGMKKVCEETGLSYETLKYYCNEGLVPNVKRDANNRRVFDEYDVAWIKDLICLRRCRLGIDELKDYLEDCMTGRPTIPRRRECLAKKKEELEEEIKKLEENIAYIDKKQKFYEDVLAGKIEYRSNLLGHGGCRD